MADVSAPPGAANASAKPAEASAAAPVLHMTDLHEMRSINDGLKWLQSEFGISLEDLLPAGTVNAEQVYPYEIERDSDTKRLTSLREVVKTLRDIGDRG